MKIREYDKIQSIKVHTTYRQQVRYHARTNLENVFSSENNKAVFINAK